MYVCNYRLYTDFLQFGGDLDNLNALQKNFGILALKLFKVNVRSVPM